MELPGGACPLPDENATEEQTAVILRSAKTIAVIGLSPNTARPSHGVSRYMQSCGYRIVPVRPGCSEILGEKCWPSLSDIPFDVDIVDVFRRPEHVPPVVEDAIAAGAGTVWMQLGIVNEEAAGQARAAGLEVVMDRCTKVDHMRLQRELGADA